ncbi:unnamed protein product [Rotaria sp. Silwood1]|nr:unnamed protein product [Rotaria sp. Silwood1]
MLITNGSRRCIIKLKECSDKRVNASRRNRRHLTEANNSTINNDQNALNADDNQGTDQSKETNEDDSFFGYLLNCKPCRQVTDNHRQKLVYYCFVL